MYEKLIWEKEGCFSFPYAKYLPRGYEKGRKYPFLLFLHGAGERGDDVDTAARHGFLKHVREQGRDYPFIIVAPQCPGGRYWGRYMESLIAFLEDMTESLGADPDRVYLTGLSMGGTGTFLLAMAEPTKFAAIAPICGSGIYWYGGALRHIPVMMVHGDVDETVPVSESVSMLYSINKRGGNAELRILHGVGHNAWDEAYEGEWLTEWFLSHKRDLSSYRPE